MGRKSKAKPVLHGKGSPFPTKAPRLHSGKSPFPKWKKMKKKPKLRGN